MTRRSFLAKLCALVAAPIAVLRSSRCGVERGERPAPDYSQVTWENIPLNDESVHDIVLFGPLGWYRRMTLQQFRAMQERRAKRA